MAGARALLAFRGVPYSADAFVGAMMEAEYQAFVISWGKAWEAKVKAQAKANKRGRR